jgi:hypothetical protein
MKEASQPVFLILGTAGESGNVNHTILELPSKEAGAIVGAELASRIRDAHAGDRTYFRVVSASAGA